MFRGQLPFSFLALLVSSGLSVGCLNKKKDEVAVEAAAPPPAAYPSTPGGYADTGSAPVSSAPSTSAPAPPSAPEPPAFKLREGETLVTYRIESGDTLGKIATKYNSSTRRIMAANGMTSDRIYAGKTLEVPTAAPPGLAMNSSTTSSSSSGSYGATGGSYGASAPAPSSSGGYSTTYPSPSSAPSYPSTTAPAPAASSPASTSYPRVASPPIPPQTSQPAGSFPTPNFGSGSGVQFSE